QASGGASASRNTDDRASERGASINSFDERGGRTFRGSFRGKVTPLTARERRADGVGRCVDRLRPGRARVTDRTHLDERDAPEIADESAIVRGELRSPRGGTVEREPRARRLATARCRDR